MRLEGRSGRDSLMLGTAQLTQRYGLFASHAAADEPAALLRFAVASGIRAFDTAVLYGDAERELGRLAAAETGIEIATKCAHLPPAASGAEKAAMIERSIRGSLECLGLKTVSVFLLHNAEAFDEAVARKLDELRQSGLAKRVGVSVYSAADIDRVLAQWDPDAVQLPLNLLDQRLIASGHLDRLRARGVEVHARSAFLQGVLVNDPAALPPWLDGLRPAVMRLVEEVGTSPKERISACLGFLAGIEAVDRIVVGAQNREQLQTIVEAADMARDVARRVGNPAAFSVNEPALVDPSRWPQ